MQLIQGFAVEPFPLQMRGLSAGEGVYGVALGVSVVWPEPSGERGSFSRPQAVTSSRWRGAGASRRGTTLRLRGIRSSSLTSGAEKSAPDCSTIFSPSSARRAAVSTSLTSPSGNSPSMKGP